MKKFANKIFNIFFEKNDDKVVKDVIKYDKLSVILNWSILGIIIFYVLNNILMYYFNSYAYFFTKYIINNINGIMYYLCSYIKYCSYIFLGLFIIFSIIFIIINIVCEYNTKQSIEKRSKIFNRFYHIFVILCFIMLMPQLFSQFTNHLPNMDEILFKSTKDKTYEVSDLVDLTKYLKEKVEDYVDNFERDEDGNIVYSIDYDSQAVSDLLNVSDKLNLLNGLYPKQSGNITGFIKGIVGSKTAGLTMPYSTYFDYSGAPTSIISTITHEMCHTKGISRENEAVFCSFLAGTSSENELSQYAAYLDGYSWVLNALSSIEYETADSLEDETLSKCLTNNYLELCDIYTKNNDEYLSNTNYIYITSYYLKHYIDYKDELYDSLKVLTDNNGAIYYDGSIISLDEAMNKITEDENNRITVVLKIDKDIFNTIKESISNSKLYLSIYQKNSDDEVSKDKENDAISYYLAPFDDKDENILYNYNYASVEYDYSRVARLILEYYDN